MPPRLRCPTAPIVSGTFRPANYEGTASDAFAAARTRRAPIPLSWPPSTGTNPNRTWSLFVRDDFSGFSGSIGGDGALNIQTAVPACCSGRGRHHGVADVGPGHHGGREARPRSRSALTSLPTADVTIALSSSDTSEGSSIAGLSGLHLRECDSPPGRHGHRCRRRDRRRPPAVHDRDCARGQRATPRTRAGTRRTSP